MSTNNNDGSIVLNTELDDSGFEKGSDKLLSAVKDLTQAVEILGDNMMQAFGKVVPLLEATATSAASLAQKTQEQATQAASANDRVAESESRVAEAAQVASETVDHAEKNISQSAKQTANSYDRALAKIQKQIDAQKAKMTEYTQKVEEVKQSTNEMLSHAETSDQVTRVLEMEEIEIEKLNSKYEKQLKILADLEAEYERLSAAKEKAEGASGVDPGANGSAAGSAAKFSAAANAATGRGVAFASVLNKIAQGALLTAKNLARISFGALKKGFQSIGNNVKNYLREAKQAKLQTNALVKSLTSLKRLLITRIKRMFISSVFNSAKEELQILTKYSDSFNAAMSNIKNSAKGLSANIAVSIGGIIQAVEPILTRVIDTLSKVISYVNAFFSLLSGKTTMTVAKKQTDSYRDSLDKTAKSAKELNREVYSFDELNKRSDDTKNDATGIDDGSNLFEEVPISDVLPEKLKDFFEELKKLWEDKKYFQFGAKLSEGLNAVLEKVDDWINGVFRPKGVEWSKNIAEILNGLVDGFNWKLLGKTIADGLNAVFDIVNTFLATFNFSALGRGIGEAIKSWFDNVDWDLIGRTFANKWNALISFIHGLVTTPGLWVSAGKSIGQFIGSWFSEIDFPKLGQTVANGINGIITMLSNITAEFQKKAPYITQSLSTGINNIFHNVDWAEAGRTLSSCVTTLLGTIMDTVKRTDWQAVGRAIGEFLSNIEWGTIFMQVGEIIWTTLKGVIDSLFDTKGGKVILAIGAGILAVKALFSAAEMAGVVGGWIGAIGNVLPGLLPIASAFVANLGSILGAIATVIFSPTGLIISAIIAAAALIITHWDEIKEAATKLWEHLTQVWESLKDSTVEKWTAIKEAVSAKATDIKDAVSTAWGNVKETASDTWELIKNTVLHKFLEMTSSIDSMLGDFKSTLSNGWESMTEKAATAWNTIKSTITQKFSEIVKPTLETVNTLKTNLSKSWNSIKNDLSRTGEDIKAGITESWNEIKAAILSRMKATRDNLVSVSYEIKENLSATWNDVKLSALTAWNSIKNTAVAVWSSIKTASNDVWSSVRNAASTAWEDIRITTSSVWHDVSSSISSAWNNITNATASAWGSIKTHASMAWTEIENSALIAWDRIKSHTENAWYSMETTAQSAWDSMKNSAENAWNSIVNTVSGLWENLKSTLNLSDWSDVGTNMVEGLKNGIYNAWDSLVSTLGDLAMSAADWVRDILGIHSPSKVFARIGEYIDLGLVEGIKDQKRAVLSSVSNMANSVANEFDSSNAVFQISADGNHVVSSLSLIADKLSNVAAIFAHIDTMLDSIGGMMIPAISTGSVVPYATRVSPNTNGSNNEIAAMSSNIDERMFDMNNKLQQILDWLDRFRGFDNDELAAALAFALRREIRGFGGV